MAVLPAGPWAAVPFFLLALALHSGAPGQEETPAGEEAATAEEPSAEPGATGKKPGEPPHLADPSLGGKLHLAYRAVYQAKFYRFGSYEFNFPAQVSPLDLEAANELEARHRERRSDHDLDHHLTASTHDLFLTDGAKKYVQSVDTDLSLRYWDDLDGTPTGDESAGIYDYSGADDFQLRTLNVRLQLLDRHVEVAGGRLYIEGAEWVHVDGGSVTARGLAFLGKPLEVTAFAGSRVSFYRTVPPSMVYGGAVRLWPWKGGRIELADVYYLANTFQATLEQRFSDSLRAMAVYRQLDEFPESLRLELDAEWPDRGLSLWLEYFGKFGFDTQDFILDYTIPTEDLRDSAKLRRLFRNFNLGDLDPYDEGTVEVRWTPNGVIGLLAGGTVHVLRGQADGDEYNSSWYEVWGGVDTTRVPWAGLYSRAVVRYVYTDLPRRKLAVSDPLLVQDVSADGEPSFLGLELLVEQDLARRVWLGASLELKRYDYDSRFAHLDGLLGLGATAYARYRQNRFLTYSLTYSYDRDFSFINPDLEDVHGIRVEVLAGF